MIITKCEIEVTEQMMFDEKLSRMVTSGMLGMPFSTTQREPVTWKLAEELTEEDFDLIEDYFLNLKKLT